MSDLLDAMIRASLEGGEIALKHFGHVRTEVKRDNSFVTVADREVEAFLRRRLSEVLPEAAFLGEETAVGPEEMERLRRSEYVWVVDPVDGTSVFADGLETFCVCVGLMKNGLPYAGAVRFPALNHVYAAEAGQGAFYDGKPIRVLPAEPERDHSTLYVHSTAHTEYRIAFKGKTRSMGSLALHYLLVARGVGTAAVSHGAIWDYLAAVAVLLEAGGEIRHLDGSPVIWTDHLDGDLILPPVLGAVPSAFEELSRLVEVATVKPKRR